MMLAHFTTSEGNFTARLFDVEVPKTVANFAGLAEGTIEWTDPRTGRKTNARYFDGTIWVDKKEYNIVRMEGQAVPQIPSAKPLFILNSR